MSLSMLLGAFFGGWEIVLVLIIVLILFGIKQFPELLRGFGQAIDEFRKAADEVTRDLQKPTEQEGKAAPVQPFGSIKLFIAQGFGVGRIPFAPGTFGSFFGLLWLVLLLSTGNFWIYLCGAIEGIAFSLWLCDDAEKILHEPDPPSVVLDEIAAIPFCFLPWVAMEAWTSGTLPPVAYFFEGRPFWLTLGILVLFRVFDIWKPWPVRQSQRLPGGWGVTVDDLLAAVYVAVISIPLVKLAA
jgi:phosphatidylglycerophosphatase A